MFLWIAFAAVVVAVLAFDLGVLGRRTHLPPGRALAIYAGYVALALGFGAALAWREGMGSGLDYLSAYLLETSLSMDNILVWLIILDRLRVPEDERRRALFWGIVGAIGMRGAFIFAGAALLARFEWLLYVLGAVVLASGVRMLRRKGEGADLRRSRLFALARRLDATPLVAAIVLIGATDLAFALDSIPAIFGVSRDPLVVYTSNTFAVLGLRALYFALAGALERLRYLRYGLALILAFIGLKMIAGGFVELPVWLTLGVTACVLAGTVVLSLARRPRATARPRRRTPSG